MIKKALILTAVLMAINSCCFKSDAQTPVSEQRMELIEESKHSDLTCYILRDKKTQQEFLVVRRNYSSSAISIIPKN